MDTLIPDSRNFFTENELSNYLTQRFFRCVRPFLSWLKKGETYWFEYHNDGEYEVRSDNNLGQKFEMTMHQLLGNFYPVKCETDICAAMNYAHWLGELGFHHGYIEDAGNMEFYNTVTLEDTKKTLDPYFEAWACAAVRLSARFLERRFREEERL